MLEENLEYTSHEIIEDTIFIHIKSNKTVVCCPDCNTRSESIHSRYTRNLEDLTILGKKAILILNNRKFFCDNQNCHRKTFAEKFG
ncbi:MAG: transposase family protein [Tissierellia bacterium]|nr:transposase family protein [Tissierellia bacterium]